MVKPNEGQRLKLENLRGIVVGIMMDMSVWQQHEIEPLLKINLGLLRRNATQRHGVTKWKRGITSEQVSLENLEVVELHPELLNEEWSAYAAFVLHHEFIHALGYRNHDKFFRLMEKSWPGINAANDGPRFTEYLRWKTAKWIWKCSKCNKEFPRKKPSLGAYKCRKCSTVLVDVKM